MFQYRQVLVRLRQGDTDRSIARSRLIGRRKLATGNGRLSGIAALNIRKYISSYLRLAATFSYCLRQTRCARLHTIPRSTI